MKKFFVNLACAFIPMKKTRKAVRIKLIDKRITKQELSIEEIAERVELLTMAMSDGYYGLLKLKMYHAKIDPKYYYIFQEINEGDICIDCGVNMGVVTDVFLHQRAEVYGFEPHEMLYPKLIDKYRHASTVTIHNMAVWDRNSELVFKRSQSDSTHWHDTEGASLFVKVADAVGFKVQVIDLAEFIEKLLHEKGRPIHVLKLDVEGAEFEIIAKLIAKELHKSIKYILCETHERLFPDGEEKIKRLKQLIKEQEISNIHLDWV